MAYQYPLNGGRINASIGGNSTSAGAGYSLVSTGTMLLAGGNNITLSQNGQSISIVGGGGAGISAGTQSVNTGTVNFANSNGISFGMSGSNQITASFSQSVQTIGGYASGNTTGQSSSSTLDARSVSVSAAGALSAGFSGSALQLSAPAQSSISGTGIISISRNASTISIGAPAFSAGMSTLGNTSGTTGTVSNQIIFAGGNNITLSQSTGAGGNTLTISAANQTNQNMSLYALGNTTQNSSTLLNASNLSFNGLGAATLGYSNGSIQVSVPTQSVQTQSNIQGIIASGSTNRTGDISFANSNGVTFGLSNNTITASVAAAGGGGVALYDGANSISSGTARVSAGGGLTASINGQTLSLSAPAQSSLSATGIFSISANGSTISMGAAAYSAGISTNGNTSGTTGFATNQLLLAGGNNITLSQSTGAGGNTLTISAANQTNQSLGLYGAGNTTGQSSSSTFDARTLSFQGAGAASVGYSNGSVIISAPNATAGNVTFSAGGSSAGLGSIVFSNSNGVSFGLNGSTITASAVGGGGGGVALYDGTNSISSGTAQISATGALTASINGQTLNLSVPVVSSLSATGAVSISNNAGTISIGAPLITSPRWEYPNQVFTTIGAPVSNSLSMQHVFIPFNVSARSARIAASISAGSLTTTGSGTVNLSFNLGLYSLNGSTLSLITSGSTLNSYQITASSTAGVSNILNGIREISAPLSANITPGDYWVGALLATAQTGSGLTVSVMGDNLLMSNGGSIGVIGSSASAANRDMLMGQGLYATAAIPSSVAISAINNTSNSNVMRAAFYHAMYSTVF